MSKLVSERETCFHCGNTCTTQQISIDEKKFCCDGCLTVYQIIHQHQLDNYYCLNKAPGSLQQNRRKNKFSILQDDSFAQQFISFKNTQQTTVLFYLPHIHCSSCLWLLENLRQFNTGILQSTVHFNKKEIEVVFNHQELTIEDVANILDSVGYEPYLQSDAKELATKKSFDTLPIGIAGFCFANIMLISFPEYLGLELKLQPLIVHYFRYINLVLALPVIGYSAKPFITSAWQNVKAKHLNIDLPIVLAVFITFFRSVYEIFTDTGAGYLDSMSGIVFFMLIGRNLQLKTTQKLQFNRNYKSYFPISVNKVEGKHLKAVHVEVLAKDDIIRLYNEEIIPVDALLSKGTAYVDYSFISGESDLHKINIGEVLYAGGRIKQGNVEVVCLKPFSQNQFISLWNNQAFKKEGRGTPDYVDILGKWFSVAVLLLGLGAFTYWQFFNPSKSWLALTTVFIVACPCALLLTSSYTYGYMMDMLSKHGFFVKNAAVMDTVAAIDTIVFDKTGTITNPDEATVNMEFSTLSTTEFETVIQLVKQSMHPLCKKIASGFDEYDIKTIEHIKEIEGKGIEAWVHDCYYKIGSSHFVHGDNNQTDSILQESSSVFVSIDDKVKAKFMISQTIKPKLKQTIHGLGNKFKLSLLSGDNDAMKPLMENMFPTGSELLFKQNPQQKLDYIGQLQHKNNKVMMIGDGLNDAGALKQSDVGIAVVEHNFSFNPACDAVLNTKQLSFLPNIIEACKASRVLIVGVFVYSILYNVIGLSFSLTGTLTPLIAAILMPASSISIILIAFIGTKYIEHKYLAQTKL